jgi:hypothetical protein
METGYVGLISIHAMRLVGVLAYMPLVYFLLISYYYIAHAKSHFHQFVFFLCCFQLKRKSIFQTNGSNPMAWTIQWIARPSPAILSFSGGHSPELDPTQAPDEIAFDPAFYP